MKGMLVVQVDRCLACKSCELACAVEHSTSKELEAATEERPAPRTRVQVEAGPGFAAPLQCRQCENAPCVTVCPTKALKRDDAASPVMVDQEKCIGCKWCLVACPFGVITLDEERRLIVKCDQCFERVQRGEMPACVSACPTHALEYRDAGEVAAEKRRASLVLLARATEEKP